MHTSDTTPAPLTATAYHFIFSLFAMALLLSGCMESYRSIDYSRGVEYDERDLLSLVTVETGSRSRPTLMDNLSHGGPHLTYADQRYERLVARWSATDGYLLAIDSLPREAKHPRHLRAGADDVLLLDQQLFQRSGSAWRQVNAGREYRTWSGSPGIQVCFTPDHRRHLFGDGVELQIRDTLSGEILLSRAMNDDWHRFAQRATFNLAEWTMDSAGQRVFCIANRTGTRAAHVLMYNVQAGSFREIPVDPALVADEPRAEFTVIEAVDVVDGKLQFLLLASERTDSLRSKIRLRIVTADGRLLYDNHWHHDYQSAIRWRPDESLLLMSDTNRPDGVARQTRITRIDYGNDRETTFLIAYPSEDEVLRHSQRR